LTGSGGPFRARSIDEFSKITLNEALNHPNWDMGAKITIDSATMMNKGLEVIEARWLFDIPSERIDIVVHPESIIHSMVEFNDGSVKAQLGLPDMKIPIQYALTYPHHSNLCWENLDLIKIGSLNFEAPNLEKFPCIRLAYDALKANDSSPIILNVANDMVVEAFLQKQIPFMDIPRYIEDTISSHDTIVTPTLEDIFELTDWTQSYLHQRINS
jgi:1-deoxy-D-xylulose-5-phosphate reductoisomerase